MILYTCILNLLIFAFNLLIFALNMLIFASLHRLRLKWVGVGMIPQELDLLTPSLCTLLLVAAAAKALTIQVVVIPEYVAWSCLFLNPCTLCFLWTKHFNLSHCCYLKWLCKLCWWCEVSDVWINYVVVMWSFLLIMSIDVFVMWPILIYVLSDDIVMCVVVYNIVEK
jgi:hypothetical protein